MYASETSTEKRTKANSLDGSNWNERTVLSILPIPFWNSNCKRHLQRIEDI